VEGETGHIALGRELVSGNVDVLGTQLEEVTVDQRAGHARLDTLEAWCYSLQILTDHAARIAVLNSNGSLGL